MEKFQLSLTGVPCGVSALQSNWRGCGRNISRVVFASERCVRATMTSETLFWLSN